MRKVLRGIMNYLRSPLNYTGNKYNLLDELMKYFPEDESFIFCDVFGGSGTVAFNSMKYNKVYYNEKNKYVFDLIKYLTENDTDKLMQEIEEIINKFNLTKTNKEGYIELREYYNNNKSPILLYVLSCYSFNHQIRFNSNGGFNSPFGKNRSHFSEHTKNKLTKFKNSINTTEINFMNLDFEFCMNKVVKENPKSKIIFYLDPPYLITTGAYNDGKRNTDFWNVEEEKRLYNTIDSLLKNKNIKFVLSNVIEHKGKKNIILSNWVKNYNVVNIEKSYRNSNYQTTGESMEVIVYE